MRRSLRPVVYGGSCDSRPRSGHESAYTGRVTDDRLALAELHLDLLYETDDAGLILRSRDHDVGAPMLHLVRTIAGNRWLVSAALSARERLMLHDALANEPVVRDLDAMQHTPPLLLGI